MTPTAAVDLDHLPGYVRERWPQAVERARRKVAGAIPSSHAAQLVKAAQRASSAPQRVTWLHRAASAWAQPLQQLSACRSGCSHCCHTPVTISGIEADLIGQHAGVTPAKPMQAVSLQTFKDLQEAADALAAISAKVEPSPCPFLSDGNCSVYDVRPMACRLLLNLDDDDLLCQLVPGQAIPVPYANGQQLKAFFLVAQPTAPWADIRDFFPGPTTSSSNSPRSSGQ